MGIIKEKMRSELMGPAAEGVSGVQGQDGGQAELIEAVREDASGQSSALFLMKLSKKIKEFLLFSLLSTF